MPTRSPTDNSVNTLFYISSLSPQDRDAEGITLLEGQLMKSGIDFEKITSARKLAATEFTINKELGYITLQRKLQNDEALAVAFEYTYNGRVYGGRVDGRFSGLAETDVVFLKLLRPRKISVKDSKGAIIPLGIWWWKTFITWTWPNSRAMGFSYA